MQRALKTSITPKPKKPKFYKRALKAISPKRRKIPSFDRLPTLSHLRMENPTVSSAAAQVEDLLGRPLKNNPKVFLSPGAGSLTNDAKLLISSSSKTVLVHELVHSEDFYAMGATKYDVGDGSRNELLRTESSPASVFSHMRLFWSRSFPEPEKNPKKPPSHSLALGCALEGRAVFAQELSKGKPNRFATETFKIFSRASAVAATLSFFAKDIHSFCSNFCQKAFSVLGLGSDPDSLSTTIANMAAQALPALATIAPILISGAIAFSAAKYWLFYNSLCTLTRKAGSPYAAFRFTAEKFPKNLGHILFPSKYYSEEIKNAKSYLTKDELP